MMLCGGKKTTGGVANKTKQIKRKPTRSEKMYGRVDRGGSREGKKSLRKNKIAIVEQKKILTQTPKLDLKDLASLPPPALRLNLTILMFCYTRVVVCC